MHKLAAANSYYYNNLCRRLRLQKVKRPSSAPSAALYTRMAAADANISTRATAVEGPNHAQTRVDGRGLQRPTTG